MAFDFFDSRRILPRAGGIAFSDGKERIVSILSIDWFAFLLGWESFKRHQSAMWIGQSSIIAERKSLVERR